MAQDCGDLFFTYFRALWSQTAASGMLVLLLFFEQMAPAVDVRLMAPLTTLVEADQVPSGDKVIEVDLVVPPDAPSDLGVGAFCANHDGRWFQRPAHGVLAPGTHHLTFRLDATATPISEPDRGSWMTDSSAVNERAGIFFWSAQRSRAMISITRLQVMTSTIAAPAVYPPVNPPVITSALSPDCKLVNLVIEGLGSAEAFAQVATGARWTMEMSAQPFPANPYDAQQFSLDALITTPDGTELRVPGFYYEPRRSADRGDQESMIRSGPGRFAVRFRPAKPGRYVVRLEARWHDATGDRRVAVALPDLLAQGPPRDQVVRADRDDPRFLSVDGRWHWPIGINMHASNDLLCRDFYGTVFTPDRAGLVFREVIERLSAHGVNAVEIWLSAWGLGLEGRPDRSGFHGHGRYNQDNAARLDEVLDSAWRYGTRINLVINHYTQASTNNPPESEWEQNPYNRERGGPLRRPSELFTAPAALAGQDNMRRYLIARYADHPGIFGWELWSESNLISAEREVVRRWHVQAVKRWHELDVYDHIVSAHWSEDFRNVHQELASLKTLDLLALDAYRRHQRWSRGRQESLSEILAGTMFDSSAGLGRYGKPVLITEYGASSGDSPDGQLEVDHTISAWVALVCGHAGSPMSWWWEWVDQGDRWQPYEAIRNFIQAEDMRAPQGRSVKLRATTESTDLWAQAWSRPGRILGYVQSPEWAQRGGNPPTITTANINVGMTVAAGKLTLEWWDADRGERREVVQIVHSGGPLRLQTPSFAGHVAFKLIREIALAEPALLPTPVKK